MRTGDKVAVKHIFELPEFRGMRGQIQDVPISILKSLPLEKVEKIRSGILVWVVFQPEGADLEIGDVDAGLFAIDDLEPCFES